MQIRKENMVPASTKKVVLALSVRIDVIAPSKLKKFSFQLDKTTEADSKEKWTILFELRERAQKSGDFGEPVISVKIDVTTQNVAKTEKTALANDFTVKQTQHVVTVVAAAAKQLNAGEITQDEFNAIVQATMNKR
ncbi:MAG: hypothetical protein NTY38_12875 [Acidobacteria bacterium]|nr:hypothetical protein [Acidobacteriota bacterium]